MSTVVYNEEGDVIDLGYPDVEPPAPPEPQPEPDWSRGTPELDELADLAKRVILLALENGNVSAGRQRAALAVLQLHSRIKGGESSEADIRSEIDDLVSSMVQ